MHVPKAKLSARQRREIMEYLKTQNNEKFNALKVAEECNETAELMIKTVTKDESTQPSLDDIIEELGDLCMRVAVYVETTGIEDAVMERAESKLAFLHERMLQGKLGCKVEKIKNSPASKVVEELKVFVQ